MTPDSAARAGRFSRNEIASTTRGPGHHRAFLAAGRILFILAAALVSATIAIYVLEFGAGPDDARTYLAAGERLNAGHELYALGPGDRPIPSELIGAGSSAPLLSPPLVAVPWRALALLPEPVALGAWWATMAALVMAALLALERRNALVAGVALWLAGAPLVWQVTGANVNAVVIAAATAAWIAWARGQVRAAGAILGVLVVLKVVPIVLILWCIAVGGRRAAIGSALGVATAGAVSLLGAGVAAHLDYLEVIRDAAGGASGLSAGAIARAVGLDHLAPAVPFVALTVGVAVVVALRRRPRLSWAAAVVTMVFGFGAVHVHSLALLLLLAAPLAFPGLRERDRRRAVDDATEREHLRSD